MRSDPFCSTLTRSEHGTITFLSQQSEVPRSRCEISSANFRKPTSEEVETSRLEGQSRLGSAELCGPPDLAPAALCGKHDY